MKVLKIIDKEYVVKSVTISPCSKFFGYVIENVESGSYKDIVKIYSKDCEKLFEKKFDTVVDDIEICENLKRIFILTRRELIVMNDNFEEILRKDLEEKGVLHILHITEDGERYSIATYNPGIVRLYEKDEKIFEWKTRNRITGYFMDIKGRYLIAADEDCFLYVYDSKGRKILEREIEKRGIYKVSIINNLLFLTISGEEFSINVLNLLGENVKKIMLDKQPLCIHSTNDAIIGAEDEIIVINRDLNVIYRQTFESYINDVHFDKNSENAIIGTDSGVYILSK